MTKQEAYKALSEEANAFPKDQIKIPYMPMGIYLQECEDLHKWSTKDKDLLIAAGIPEPAFDELDLYINAARHAQSLWMEDYQSKQMAEKKWAELSPKAYELRDHLLHAFRYAYRDDAEILTRVATIAEGNTNSDMIQDLSDCQVLGKSNPEPLMLINFKMEELDEAGSLSDEMADLNAEANGEKHQANESMIIRDKMYSMLKLRVDAIRNCGKYVFWKDKDRLIGYSSRHNRNRGN